MEHILTAGPVVKTVLLLLLLASIHSWAIIANRATRLRRATSEDREFLAVFRQCEDLESVASRGGRFNASPIGAVFRAAHEEFRRGGGKVETLERAMNKAATEQVAFLEAHISWLATIASATPFVGLFGTVWGIMNAFASIGRTGSANLAVVAPGISEALVTTAAGLAAAIPAVVAYNHFVQRIRGLAQGMDNFSQEFLNLLDTGLPESRGVPGARR